MSQDSKTKMEHPYSEQTACAYRLQARRALVSYALMSFSAGVAVSFGICVFSHAYRTVHSEHHSQMGQPAGTLKRNAKLPCPNTFLA